MEGQVIMSLDTYQKMSEELTTAKRQNELLQSQIDGLKCGKGIFRFNKIYDNIYIELDELGAEIVMKMASIYSETHKIPEITVSHTVTTLSKKPEVNPNA